MRARRANPDRRQFEPAYAALTLDELRRRRDLGRAALNPCTACPRNCGVDRLAGEIGVCRTGRHGVVSSAFPHHGEEDPLRGWNGSGTIFFSWCNLRCVFCQNWDISQEGGGHEVSPDELAAMMLRLQATGCHNINLVTPEHVVPQILEALPIAVEAGLNLPIVYNTSTYDAAESLALLDGIVDIYMPDFKFWDVESARMYVKAKDYPDVARRGLREMHRQVGDLVIDESGLARRGLLVRHLVMPGMLDETREVFRFLAREISPRTYVNVMAQYRPAGQADRYDAINRPLRLDEYQEAIRIAQEEGLVRLDGRAKFPTVV